ncbi:hypothetical protein MPTK1_4g08850 [Marchantia polymorpha subsp. ruderalis]|uniref:Uncharacterized protein n=2 Tax=Marchantia polymorpha TaxID=3197 RepID=A0AAF6B7W4_MARPO|nr:hypothetical protein MARPO_0188s0007 [Marchantia polymorpha]BBN08098.1 hypothetical protein Mp_4g08850 [Marchantia polymorpha subsp. ruderalis]|eukprot:PTQ27661.1 hypothetical protein MARPO_0188s0007 [Marchantia polymorpha]
MGIRVELPSIRRRKAVGMKGEADSFAAATIGWDADLRAVDRQSLDIDISELTPPRIKNRPPGIQTSTTLANALADSPDSGKHLISPCSLDGGRSSDPASPLSCSTQSNSSPSSSNQGCADAYRRRMKKRCDSQGLNPLSFSCRGSQQQERPSRWDSARWSATSDFGSSSHGKRNACYCAAGVTGDVAAVCCCPFSLLHLLALALIKLPTVAVSKLVRKIKRRIVIRRRTAIHEDENDSVVAPSSYPPSRSRSYEEGEAQTWAPTLGFGHYGDSESGEYTLVSQASLRAEILPKEAARVKV